MPIPLWGRRRVVAMSAAVAAVAAGPAAARSVRDALPWAPNEAYPPPRVMPGTWQFFTSEEAAAVSAMADRLIPADALSPSGGQAGCAVFLDAQLAGVHGSAAWLYMRGPFAAGTPQQGMQDEHPPSVQYRAGLAAIAAHCRAHFGGRPFPVLSAAEQDAMLTAMEAGRAGIADLAEKPFFEILLASVMEGFFADPTYGGNRDMAGWKLLGFPGARYDFREVLERPGQPYPDPPMSLRGRPAWDRSPA